MDIDIIFTLIAFIVLIEVKGSDMSTVYNYFWWQIKFIHRLYFSNQINQCRH